LPNIAEVLGQLKPVIQRVALFSSLSLFYSFFSLVGPRETHPQFSIEAGFGIEEFSAHLLFGLIAALPTLDWRLMAYCGVSAVAIDLDHLPVTFGLQVIGRPAHSFTFAAFAGVLMGLAFRPRRWLNLPIALTTLSAVLSHISYDLYEASHLEFPLFLPLSSE